MTIEGAQPINRQSPFSFIPLRGAPVDARHPQPPPRQPRGLASLRQVWYCRRMLTLEQRFWNRVDPCRTDGCAVWLGAKLDGYGRFYVGYKAGKRKYIYAHLFLVGKAPEGLEWDHLCRNRACVWPECLEAVTHQENIRRSPVLPAQHRARGALVTHCPEGHEYTQENTYITRDSVRGWRTRSCKICRKLRMREWRRTH